MTNQPISVLDKGFVRLVDHLGSDAAIVQAARVSYGAGTKTPSDDRTLIRYLLRNKHTSPFEMCEFVFHCKMPIFVARQWIRHRTANVNEISGRYSELPNDFYVPEDQMFTRQNPTNKQGGSNEVISLETSDNIDAWVEWGCFGNTPQEGAKAYDTIENPWSWAEQFKKEQELARECYERWLGTGVRRELARINLPLSQYTEWYWKLDLHNLLHFLKLRLDDHAQYEIRVYAQAILNLIEPIVPFTIEAFKDYSLNAVMFSKLDLELLSKLKKNNSITKEAIEDAAKQIFTNKREREEAVAKILKVYGL